MSAGPVTGAAPAPPGTSSPARSGDLTDRGASRRDRVRARSWSLAGSGRVTEDVELDDLVVEGELTVGGSVSAERCRCEGHLSTGGAARGGAAWQLGGESRIGGSLAVGALQVAGRLDVRGDLTVSGPLRVDGTLDVTGAIRAGSVHLDGSLTAAGELSAPECVLIVRGPSRVAALRGRRLTVSRPAPFWATEPPMLDALEVEGAELRLAGVLAQYVRGDRITLGPGCRLAKVDGAIVQQDRRSTVGPTVRSPRPKGLSP